MAKVKTENGRETMNLSLTPEMKQWLQDRADVEFDGNASAVVRALIREKMNEERGE